MKSVKVLLGQNFEVTRNGETMQTSIKLNGANFKVETIEAIDSNKLAYGFVNALFTRFEAKEAGVKLPFAISQPIDLKIFIDGDLAFDLGYFASETGYQIKFPAYLARKDKKAARKQLAASFEYAVNAGKAFASDMQAAVI